MPEFLKTKNLYTGEQLIEEQIPEYSELESNYFNYLKERLANAQEAREQSHDEFNGMTYTEWFESNAKAAFSYIPPKKSEEEIRTVSGFTEEKEVSILSALLNYNFDANIRTFDEDNRPVYQLGEAMEELLEKSKELEYPVSYEQKRVLIYKELLDQGNVFIEDGNKIDIKIKKKMLKELDWNEEIPIDKIKWEEQLEILKPRCEFNQLDGRKVYLGSMRQFYISLQPYVFTAEIVPYSEAEQIFRNMARWKYVPRKLRTPKSNSMISESPTAMYQDWTLFEHEKDSVEIIKYQDKYRNEFMILCNGVMMLPVGFPLTAISPSGEYTIAQGHANPIHRHFAYSKGIPAKTKVAQAVMDEMLKNMILEMQLRVKPPMADNSGRSLSKEVFMPGKIFKDVDPASVAPIGEHKGVEAGQFNMFKLVSEILDKQTVSPTFEGEGMKGQQTATEIKELRRQSMSKIAFLVSGVIGLEWQMSWLRLFNILANWSKPIAEQKIGESVKRLYQRFNIKSDFDMGVQGEKEIEFTNKIPEQSTIDLESRILSRERRKPVKKVYIKSDDSLIAKYLWYITIESSEQETDALDRAMLFGDIQALKTIFESVGIPLNYDYLKGEAAKVMKRDKDKLFPEGQEGQTGPGQTGMAQMGGQGGQLRSQVMAQGGARRPQQPSVNTLNQ